MTGQVVTYLASIAGVFVIGLVVMLRSKQAVFRLYGTFSIALGIWLLIEYLLDEHFGNGTLLLEVVSVISLFLGSLFVMFAYAYPNHYVLSRRWIAIIHVPIILLSPLCFTPLVVRSVTYDRHEVDFISGPLYNVATLIVVVYLLAGIVILLSRLRHADMLQKSQIYLLALAFGVAIVGNLLAGYVFADSPYWQIVRPISLFLTLSIVAYAMVYRRLFDIRGYAVRAVTYTLVIILVAVVYTAFAVLPADYISHAQLSAGVLGYLALVMIVVAFFFHPLVMYFNKKTSQLFFRDYYEPQDFFNEFNRVLASTIELKDLLGNAIGSIEKTLKTSFCTVVLYRPHGGEPYITGTNNKKLSSNLFTQIHNKKLDNAIVVTDYLSTVSDAVLKKALELEQIDILARLGGGTSSSKELGYIVLGPKKSGNVYTQQDINTIEAVASELIIAVQNALRFEEIERFNFTLQQRVEDATRKLRQSNDKLRTLDQTKDDFISMASHQLRTPLTSIKGYVSMVLDGDAGPINPMQRKLLDQSFTSSQRMVYLIADLLNISRLKTGRFVIEPTPTNLAQITKDEVSQLVETARSRGLELTYDKPQNFPTYMLDTVKTRQVIMNFVDNAIYYTPKGGHIHVELSDNPKSIELRVIDDGIGVPRALQHHLFTKFYRAPNAQKARPDGTGLGLFMAKKVIIAQGGAIVYETTEGKGSTFGFSFAKSHLELPSPEPVK